MEQKIIEITRIINSASALYMLCAAPLLILCGGTPLNFLCAALPVLFFLLLEALQDRIRGFIPFAALRLLMFAAFLFLMFRFFGAFLIGGLEGLTSFAVLFTVLYGIVCAVFVIYSFYRRIMGVRSMYPSFYLTLYYIGAWILCVHFGSSSAASLAFFLEVVLLCITILYRNLSTLAGEFSILEDSRGVPYSPIRRTNMLMMSLFFAGCALVLVLTASFRYWQQIVTAIKNGLFAVLRAILLLIVRLIGSGEQPIAEGEEEAAQMQIPDLGPSTANPFLDAFWHALSVITIILMVCLLTMLLYKTILWLYRTFNAADFGHSRDTTISLLQKETRENALPVRGSLGRRIRGIMNPSDEEKIRRNYRKLLQQSAKRRKTSLRAGSAPAELEEIALGEAARSEDGTLLHNLYERARYAPDHLESGDESAVRSAVKKINHLN